MPLTREQIQGRNMWMVWTGGNDRLWDELFRRSFGTIDLLKTNYDAAIDPAVYSFGSVAPTG